MGRRVVIRKTHQLVGIRNGLVSTRCGLEWKKPKTGFGDAVTHGSTCSACAVATEEILATLVAAK